MLHVTGFNYQLRFACICLRLISPRLVVSNESSLKFHVYCTDHERTAVQPIKRPTYFLRAAVCPIRVTLRDGKPFFVNKNFFLERYWSIGLMNGIWIFSNKGAHLHCLTWRLRKTEWAPLLLWNWHCAEWGDTSWNFCHTAVVNLYYLQEKGHTLTVLGF